MANISKLAGLKSKAKSEGWLQYVVNPADELALLNGCYFDKRRAERVHDFFPRFIKHTKGTKWAGKPFVPLDWQREEIIFPLFGWYRPDKENRRFKSSYIEIPKKNGKSTLAAAIGIYKFIGDGETGAHVFSAASTREQAGIVHDEAIRMIKGSDQLSDIVKINRSTHVMTFPRSSSMYKSIAHAPEGNEGLDISCVIIDELHAWKKSDLFYALRWGAVARTNPLMFIITTAGDDDQSVCWQEHEKAEQIIKGEIKNDSIMCLLYSMGQGDDWTDPDVWKKANPSMGEILTEEDFAQDVEDAKSSTTAEINLKRYRLNKWSLSTNPWIRVENWDRCGRVYDEEQMVKKECYGGLDLAKTQDTTSFSLVFPVQRAILDQKKSKDDGNSTSTVDYRSLTWFWLPELIAREQSNKVGWQDWANSGFVKLTDGDVADYLRIQQDLLDIFKRFNIQSFCFDPWQAQSTTQFLMEETGVERVEFSQNMRNYAEPTAEFERLVIEGNFHHNFNSLLTWQVKHCQVKPDNNKNIRPIKPPRQDHKKIDGVVATVMALSLAMQKPGKTGSIYDEPGNLSM